MKHLMLAGTLAALACVLTVPVAAEGIPFRVKTLEELVQELDFELGETTSGVLANAELLGELQQSQAQLVLRVDELEKVLSTLPRRYIFATSGLFDGNLGGLDGADQKCQDAAFAAGLDGQYLAWLSKVGGPIIGEPASGPLHRFVRHHVPYVRPDGIQVADHFGDLVDGTLDNPISADEFGGTIFEGTAWSSTSANGTPVGGGNPLQSTCGNWTTNAFLTTATFIATIGAVDFTWSSPGAGIGTPCTQRRRLICVQQ
jgi:hypothetical protein